MEDVHLHRNDRIHIGIRRRIHRGLDYLVTRAAHALKNLLELHARRARLVGRRGTARHAVQFAVPLATTDSRRVPGLR